ncbi:MAG: DUF4270 family protein [Bacteroidales bacterium]|nr:DUF4270 family protein [Candidatus Cacconaster merdequi]
MTKVRSFVGTFVATALFSITSCITIDNSIGGDLIPANHIFTIESAEFDIPVELRAADSLQAGTVGTPVVGALNTSTYGKFRASVGVSIVPVTDSIVWGKEPEFVSMTLSVPTSITYCESEDQSCIPQNLYVYALKGPVDSTMRYSGSLKEEYCDFSKTVSKGNIVYTGDEFLSLQFTEEYGKQFFKYSMEMMDSTAFFLDKFPGLYFTCDECDDGILGGRLNTLTFSDTYAILTYSSIDDDGFRSEKDVMFSIADRSLSVYSSESKKFEGTSTEDFILSDGLTGIKPVVKASAIKEAVKSWADEKGIDLNSILINRAVIEFPIEYDKENPDCLDKFPSHLFPCRFIENTYYNYFYYEPVTDIKKSDIALGEIDRSLLCYRADIGSTLSEILKKSDSEITHHDDLWIMPIMATTDESNTTYYFANYLNYYQCRLNGTKNERRPKIYLTYTNVIE